MFVNGKFIFTLVCLFNLYDLLIGSTLSWESCCEYFVYMILIPLSPSSLFCIQKSGLTPIFLDLPFICP